MIIGGFRIGEFRIGGSMMKVLFFHDVVGRLVSLRVRVGWGKRFVVGQAKRASLVAFLVAPRCRFPAPSSSPPPGRGHRAAKCGLNGYNLVIN